MTDNTKLFLIDWFNHYDDKFLKEDYETLEKIFGENEDKIECLYDCDEFAAFKYDAIIHDQLMKFDGGLFEPEYFESTNHMLMEYFEFDDMPEGLTLPQFFSDLEYQKKLVKIGMEAGGDEREFDRLWTNQFVFGDEYSLAY